MVLVPLKKQKRKNSKALLPCENTMKKISAHETINRPSSDTKPTSSLVLSTSRTMRNKVPLFVSHLGSWHKKNGKYRR
jgi:hypothetical protein